MNKFVQLTSLTALLALLGCTTSHVKMTDTEVQTYFNESSGYYSSNFGKGVKQEWIRDRNYCEKATGKCWQVECEGAYSKVNCWKTPSELSKALAATELPSSSAKSVLETCESIPATSPAKRTSCFEYLKSASKDSTAPEKDKMALRVLKTFCDLKDVSCTLNYNKFGKGNLNTDGIGSKISRGVYQTAPKASSEEVDTYEFYVLKN